MKKNIIVVLGNTLNQDGTMSETLIKRVEKGLSLFDKSENSKIIMAGRHSFDFKQSRKVVFPNEAVVMKKYAESLGFLATDILTEETSLDTVGNAHYTKVNILEKNNWKKIKVVTSDFHIERTRFIFDLILGDGYEIEYVPAENCFSPDLLLKTKEKEEKLLDIFRQVSSKVADTTHIYNEIQKYFKEHYQKKSI